MEKKKIPFAQMSPGDVVCTTLGPALILKRLGKAKFWVVQTTGTVWKCECADPAYQLPHYGNVADRFAYAFVSRYHAHEDHKAGKFKPAFAGMPY